MLETFRSDWNWTLGGVATAQIIGIAVALIGLIWLIYNHPRGKKPYPYLPPWTPEREHQERLALAGAAAGGGTLAMAGGPGTDSDDDSDSDEWDDDDDEDEFEDTDTDNDEPDDSKNETSEDF